MMTNPDAAPMIDSNATIDELKQHLLKAIRDEDKPRRVALRARIKALREGRWAKQQLKYEQQQGRVIAGKDINARLPADAKRGGFQHRAIEGSGYIARQGEPFVRRAVAKVKGKAAAKAAKKARHAARNESQRTP